MVYCAGKLIQNFKLFYKSNRPHFLWVYRRDNPLDQSEALPRSAQWRVIRMELLRSFLAGKPVVPSPHVGCFPAPAGYSLCWVYAWARKRFGGSWVYSWIMFLNLWYFGYSDSLISKNWGRYKLHVGHNLCKALGNELCLVFNLLHSLGFSGSWISLIEARNSGS